MNLALSRRKKEQGFTIIEVLMAISIFAIGILAVATMQYGAIRVNLTAGKITIRTTYAQDRLERLMALPYTHADLIDTESGDVNLATEHEPPVGEQVPGLVIKWWVNDNVTMPNSKYIIVRVTEGIRSVELVTIRTSSI